MMGKPTGNALDSIARRGLPEDINLWPTIQARLSKRKTFMNTLRARPALAVLLVVVLILLLTGAAYAVGLLTRYIPGVGFVETSSLRILAEPVSQTRGGITVTIEQVAADGERTVVVYKTEGMTIQAANSQGEAGGASGFGSKDILRLPDGTVLQETPSMGYGGTPEPIINDVQTEGGWPNYVYRLVYPSIDPRVKELTLVIPVLQNMPRGAAPENWEVPFQLKPAPPGMTFAPMIGVSPQAEAATGTPLSGSTEAASPSNKAILNGITFQLDNVIESQDGFVFTGDLAWDSSIFPSGKGVLGSDAFPAMGSDIKPTLTDDAGQEVPIEPVQLNAPYVEGHSPWSYRTNRKALAGPLTFTIPSIPITSFASEADFELDLGPDPQIGQAWKLNHDFQVEGHTIRLLSARLEESPSQQHAGDPCAWQKVNLEFSFAGDVPGIGATLSDLAPEPTPEKGCVSGSWGGGGPAPEPTKFTASLGYIDIPRGRHRFSMAATIPQLIAGPWQITWQPPTTSAVTVTAEQEACLTEQNWKQALDRAEPLPSGLGGKILTTVDEGGQLPALYLQTLDGSPLGKFDLGAWPALSPDGTRLVYGSSDALHIVDLTTGQDSSFTNDGYAHHWSPDNTRLLYTTTFGLYIINADGSGLQKIDTGTTQVISVVGWLPDNQTIVYGAMGGAGFTFTSYNLQSAERKPLFAIQNKAGYGALSPDGQWIVFADRIFGANNWGIFISRLDGSDRRPVAAPGVPTAFTSVWGPDGAWLIVNTLSPDGTAVPLLVNPFTCRAARLSNLKGMVEAWSP